MSGGLDAGRARRREFGAVCWVESVSVREFKFWNFIYAIVFRESGSEVTRFVAGPRKG